MRWGYRSHVRQELRTRLNYGRRKPPYPIPNLLQDIPCVDSMAVRPEATYLLEKAPDVSSDIFSGIPLLFRKAAASRGLTGLGKGPFHRREGCGYSVGLAE